MHATELVALCDAQGIDFIHVAGCSSNTKGVKVTGNPLSGAARPRRRTLVEIESGITEIRETSRGKETRSSRPKAWSQVDLGIAAYGVEALHWAASQHTIANDRTPETIRVLMCGLRHYANKLATHGNWESTVPARRSGHVNGEVTGARLPPGPRRSILYVEQLCMLVLDEISFRPAFAATAEHPELAEVFAIYMGVEQQTWQRLLAERFALLQQRYAVWYGSGLGMIQQMIRGRPEESAA